MTKIHIPGWLGANIYCAIILLYIYISARRAKFSASKELKAYSNVIFVVLLSLIADTLSRFYLYKDFRLSCHYLILLSTYIKYISLPLAIPMFYKYFMYKIKGLVSTNVKILYYSIWIVQIIYTFIVLSTFFNKFTFYYDLEGIYHRGDYYAVPVSIITAMCIIVELSIILNRKKLSKRNYTIFSVFLLIPVLGILLQTIFYGLAITQMAISFSALIVFISIISQDINKDHLTSLHDRKVFDMYIDDFILNKSTHPFSVIMVDIDDFKLINDKFGHSVGDEALISTANILGNSVRLNDIVCRYGGDEFLMLIPNCDKHALDLLIERIKKDVSIFNKEAGKVYKIKLSIGGAVYSDEKYLSMENFLEEVDKNMYLAKKKNKEKYMSV